MHGVHTLNFNFVLIESLMFKRASAACIAVDQANVQKPVFFCPDKRYICKRMSKYTHAGDFVYFLLFLCVCVQVSNIYNQEQNVFFVDKCVNFGVGFVAENRFWARGIEKKNNNHAS